MEIVSVIVAWMACMVAWGWCLVARIWWAHDGWDDSTFYIGNVLWRKLAPARIRLNGWPRLRRWLTDGPLPAIRRISTERRPGCDCDGCYVDTCPTFWCRGVWDGVQARTSLLGK